MNKRLIFVLLLSSMIFFACENKKPLPAVTQEPTEAIAATSPSISPPEATTAVLPETQIPATTIEPTPAVNDEPVENTSGVIWIIEPILEYNKINYCICGYFDHLDFSEISTIEETLADLAYDDGTVWLCLGHGFTREEYFFDESRNNFVVISNNEGGTEIKLYSPEEFVNAHFYHKSIGEAAYGSYLYAIREIDIEKIKVLDYGQAEIESYSFYDIDTSELAQLFGYDTSDACSDKFAIAYGDKLLTDFIYAYTPKGSRYFYSEDMIELCLDGKWGVMNKNGDLIIPFIFEDIEFIDEFTAFAGYNGKYGVVDIKKTIHSLEP